MKLVADISTIEASPEELALQQEPQNVGVAREELAVACRASLDVLAGTAMPDTCTLLFPATYKAIWQLLTSAVEKSFGFERFAIGLPRGFTKTTLLKLFVLYCILFTDRNFILIVCKTAKHATNFVADVVDLLDSSNILSIFGNWRADMDKDTQDLIKVTFRGRSVVIAAVGSSGNVRGFNLKNRRPDIILMDDMQSRDNAASQQLSADLLDWMMSDLMKANSKVRCCYIFVGNMYPYQGSILRLLKRNPAWTSFIAGGLLADGESIWPELQSREQLLEEYENDLAMGKPEIFLAEVLNDDTASGKSGIDVSAIPTPHESLFNEPMQGSFIIIDPSNDKKFSDAAEVGYFEVRDGKPCMMERRSGKWNPGDLIREALILASEHGCKLIAVESVAFQYSLLYWFEQITAQQGLYGFHFVELYPRMSKNARIREMLGLLIKGDLLLHPSVRNDVIYQINQWNPLKTDNVDDLLDVLAYAYQVMDTYRELMASDIFYQLNELGNHHVKELADNSLF